jgi:hypothetical protein
LFWGYVEETAHGSAAHYYKLPHSNCGMESALFERLIEGVLFRCSLQQVNSKN